MQIQKVLICFAILCISYTQAVTNREFYDKKNACFAKATGDCGLFEVSCKAELFTYQNCVFNKYYDYSNDDLTFEQRTDSIHDTAQYAKASIDCGPNLDNNEVIEYAQCACQAASAQCSGNILVVFAVLSILAFLF